MGKRLIYIVPLEGLTVRVPNTKAKLPGVGAWVPAESYWLRRITDGSVREAEQPKETIEEVKEKTEVEFKETVIRNHKNKHKEGY